MDKKIYIIIQVLVFIIPIMCAILWRILSPSFPRRHIIEIGIILIVVLSISAYELYAYNIYTNQKKDMPDISEVIKVKIIAGKFTDGIFNNYSMKMHDYPRITNEATIAYGETFVPYDIVERMPKYSIDLQLFDYLFLKVLSYSYNNGWFLVHKRPFKSDSIFISPQYKKEKLNTNIYRFQDTPAYIREYNLYFNNKNIFLNGSYVGRKTITLFHLFEDPEQFRIILPPGVTFKIGIDKDGWPDHTYKFTHKYFDLTISIQGFVSGPGYPMGFHKQNSRTIKEDFNRVRSSELIVNFDAKFKQTLNEQELKDMYSWAMTLLECFRFYFDYEEFEKSFNNRVA
ncbi:MAG: hypothetical protein WC738_04500 [Candidatus Omnitrophota bacterium]|jgi:hypothetical protein